MHVRLDTLLWLTVAIQLAANASFAAGPYQATGLKVGEVDGTSAIVWTRLTRNAKRNSADGPMVTFEMSKTKKKQVVDVIYPAGTDVSSLRDAVPGTAGEVRVLYQRQGVDDWRETDWHDVDPQWDFTHQFKLTGLQQQARYALRVESRSGGEAGQTINGEFRTAPAVDDPARVVFTVSTGQAFRDKDLPEGYKIYAPMLALDPSFFVHTGDIVYYDRLAKTAALANYHWQRTYGLPTNVTFHNRVASYFIKDDHDSWQNDCWPTMKNQKMFQFTFAQGLAIFPKQVPMGRSTYRTRRWGKDLQIWLVEGRDFRSANTMPDGPTKTIWGEVQKDWFKQTVEASDATFKVLISPTPVVGPDRTNKNDNHANKGFTHAGDALRKFIARQKNLVVVCGDRHWQYMSVHPGTGVREYSCGPASNQHAGGWKQSDLRPDYHKYLNVVGGFLSATVDRKAGAPTLSFRYHDVAGKVLFEDHLTAD